jgi:hypothetical protein
MARALIIAPVLVMLAVLAVFAQGDVNSVRARIEKRFDVLPIANGVVLMPRFKTDLRSIEVSESTIAIDGAPVSGPELRQRLGADADLVLQLSYLDPAARRSLAGSGGSSPVSQPDPPATIPDPEVVGQPTTPRLRYRDDVVRIGGSISIEADESVRGDVVVIGGSARVDGQIDGELVVVGGSATLGPQADIRRDVTVVGGALSRDPKALIRGKVQEVGVGEMFGRNWGGRDAWAQWNPMGAFYPLARFMGTLVRVGLLMLLAGLVILIARRPVEQIADRAAAEPVKSWAIGFLAEILFVPILVFTVVVLAISIVGIPLLLLVPVAIVASMVVFLVGFTGIAFHVGRLLEGRVDWLRARPYASTLAGIVLILSPLLVARLLGLTGVAGFLLWPLVAAGFIAEYVAWTTGLGAAALVRFGRPTPPPPPLVTSSTSPMVTT